MVNASVSLQLFKMHVRADDFAADDIYLQHLLDTATVSVVTATNQSVEELTADCGGELPLPLQQAIMMLAAHWYNQRESSANVQMYEVPDSLQTLIKPYKRLAE